jgi:riboflavin kinase/FMN adenylyltransferase
MTKRPNAMIRWISGVPEAETNRVVAVGSFDGVHSGHAQVINYMTGVAQAQHLEALVASFDPHPRSFLSGMEENRLTSIDERARLLKAAGVSSFVTLGFSRAMAEMSAERFIEDILLEELRAQVIVVGHDHRFGKGRAGNAALLRCMGKELGFEVIEVDAMADRSGPVSSSRIRSHVRNGEVKEATRLLQRRYALCGTVVKGAGRGRIIGVPTANIKPSDPLKILPCQGVYAVLVQLPGTPDLRPGMMNIGSRPTFDGTGTHLEVHLLDWSGDLYGREVRVEFVEWVRNEQKFEGPDALVAQLNEDSQRCRRLLRDVS